MKKIFVPGSKSITNRVLLLAAISDKPVELSGLLDSDDVIYMKAALKSFGVKFEDLGKNHLKIFPPKKLETNKNKIYIGNAGTATRFLSALSLVMDGEFSLSGVDRMHERPQKDLFESLKNLGVEVICHENKGFLPVTFNNNVGADLSVCPPAEQKGEHTDSPLQNSNTPTIQISGKASSQFLSGLLLVAPKLQNGLEIKIIDRIPSLPYIKMTLEILKIWGVKFKVSEDFLNFKIFSGILAPQKYHIPADMSSTSYPLLWSVLKREKISIENFGEKTLQGDEDFLKIIQHTGAKIIRKNSKLEVHPDPKRKFSCPDINWESMPDVSMTGMILASFDETETKFTGLESLRVKECDRIVAMEQLSKLRVEVKISDDDMSITGDSPENLIQKIIKKLSKTNNSEIDLKQNFSKKIKQKILLDSFDDHRIAMCFGILKSALHLGADSHQESPIEILEPECVSKTWPEFWIELADWENQLRKVSGIILIKNNISKNPVGAISNRPSVAKKFLIVKKPRKDHAWQFPQGGMDEGEKPKQAALRELHEECGKNLVIKFKGERPSGIYKYLFPKGFSRHFNPNIPANEEILGAKVTFFKAEFISGEVEIDNKEIIDHKWVTADDLKNYFDAEYLENIKYFL